MRGARRLGLAVSVVALATSSLAVGTESVNASNFGSSNSAPIDQNIFLAANAWVEFSTHWGFLGGPYPAAPLSALANFAIEGSYEPTDLAVQQMADNTVQDVTIFPGWGASNVAARTFCNDTPWGADPWRHCNYQAIVVFLQYWTQMSNNEQSFLFGHEFGHAVGLRHSVHCSPEWDFDSACAGVGAGGVYVQNTHPVQQGYFMGPFTGSEWGLHTHDVQHINVVY
jgi:hypothetical protein